MGKHMICPNCQGTGFSADVTCPQCLGTGLLKEGDTCKMCVWWRWRGGGEMASSSHAGLDQRKLAGSL
ncbi:hypothetical protein [Thermogemmatispora tikiterensis]|uniref:Uncharacterized protein n=1 Tax=Thermogemmatispora tikiterensis TaxID=1825093 RepID=A0A328V8H8_9CHLR|nr:hypothetical protein [Thermogemmatispora tikiterensis]RAQ93906.1 hypothetical protein A4R35_00075 [Thermogemmatispora tikiterensis]